MSRFAGAQSTATLRRLRDGHRILVSCPVVIGRHSSCGVVIDSEEGVSRQHAKLEADDKAIYLSDLDSKNGTLLNNQPLTGRTALKSGDVLQFDVDEYEVLLPDLPGDGS